MKIHVCLVSAQAAPNLLAAMDPELKPEKVILVISPKMQTSAKNLTAVLENSGIKVRTHQLRDEHDYQSMCEEMLELATELEGHEVYLNLTGGTKLMSLASQEAAGVGDWKRFYVDLDTDQVIGLEKDAPRPRKLAEKLRLRHYLRSYGFETVSSSKTQPTSAEAALIADFCKNTKTWQASVSKLNFAAQNANKQGKFNATQQLAQHDFAFLIEQCEKVGWLKRVGSDIYFNDRQRCNGGWLELYAMNVIHKLHGGLGIQDSGTSIEVLDLNSNTKNELDVAFIYRNRLYIIECKTSRLDKKEDSEGVLESKANDALFKLASHCRRIGGAGARGMFLSYRKLSEHEHNLAHALNIEVVQENKLAELESRIKRWVQA